VSIIYLGPEIWFLANTEGVKFEKEYAENKNLPDPTTTDNVEYKIVLSILKESIPKRPSSRVCPRRPPPV
jgi:hypothetical protein